MPEEREIEKQLRAAAEQRRKEAGGKFELHPASRRWLQGEVVRVRGQKPAPPRRVFWPRFAWETSMLAVLAVGVWVLVSSQKKSETISLARVTGDRFQREAAKDDQRSLAETRMDGSPAQAAAKAEAKELAIVNPPVMKKERTTTVATFDRPISGAIPSQEKVAAASAPKEVASAITPAVKVDRMATVVDFERAESVALPTQRQSAQYNFRNANTASLGIASTPAKSERTRSPANESRMLDSFQLEQQGNQIRILDHDGSIYVGTLLADTSDNTGRKQKIADTEYVAKSLKTADNKPAALADEDNQFVQQNFRFVAAGTNLSLRQLVTIRGEFSADASAVDKASFNGQNISAPSQKAKLQNNAGLSNGRIIGRAVTADGQVIEMNASQMPSK